MWGESGLCAGRHWRDPFIHHPTPREILKEVAFAHKINQLLYTFSRQMLYVYVCTFRSAYILSQTFD